MRKLVVLGVLAAFLLASATAMAHPLGNFTTNHYSRLEVSGERIYVLYVLDLAEIPTYQDSGELARLGREGYARRLAAEIGGKLTLLVDGTPSELHELRHALAFPPGAGGLATTRLEIVYDGGPAGEGDAPVALAYSDRSFANRVGWREVVLRVEEGARAVSADVPALSASNELRAYPDDQLESPLDVTGARATVEGGSGAGSRPTLLDERGEGPSAETTAAEDGFASLITRDDLGIGVILLSLLVAMFWGAAHALTPGHGKAIVAAYLVGTRGTARHAFLLGGIITLTHTIGVFALGLVTLSLSEFVVPEELYPWLNLVSAVLVVLVGIAVLRLRLVSWFRRDRAHSHDHHHDHHHHDHGGHGHSHVPERGSGLRGLVAVGISGGLLPCPTALVVLLAAISLHRVGYGLVLILAFSIGLAATITGIGLIAVTAKRAFSRMSFQSPLVRLLPAVSALVIIGLGIAMTVRALPSIA